MTFILLQLDLEASELKRDVRMSRVWCLVICCALFAQHVRGLSYSVCDTVLEEYTTDSSRLTGTWPYYNLLYT